MWGSIFFTPQEDLLVVTRPQRLLILTATCLTSMAMNAIFFGSDTERVSSRFVAAAISAASMVPVERLSPRLFGFINTFRAESLDVSYAVRQQRAKDIAARKAAALAALEVSRDAIARPHLINAPVSGLWEQDQPVPAGDHGAAATQSAAQQHGMRLLTAGGAEDDPPART